MRSIERGTAAIARPHSTPLEGASCHSTPHSTSFNPARRFIKNHESGFFIQAGHSTAMGGAFNSAWALLKNESYPPTPEDKRMLDRQENAYTKARSDYPQTSNITDEAYEEFIDDAAQLNLAQYMNSNDYPWPKKEKFQTTFLDRGNLSFDRMLTQQRKLNARMARESNRREAIPSRIEIHPDSNSKVIRNFELVNDEGKTLSRIRGNGANMYNENLSGFYGETLEPYRRQGMYKKLMQALIGAGIPISSDERNPQSHAFHQNLLESLPPNIRSSYVDEYGNPRNLHPFLEGMENRVEDLNYNHPLEYQRQPVPEFLDAQGQRSGLNRADYGAFPIVNQANQVRSMDEMAEQDRAKIRQGKGHEPETQGILTQQPMARNTRQSQLYDFL